MAGNRIIELVLNVVIELPGGFRIPVVVGAALGKNISDLLIDASFAGTNGAHPLQ